MSAKKRRMRSAVRIRWVGGVGCCSGSGEEPGVLGLGIGGGVERMVMTSGCLVRLRPRPLEVDG